MDNRMLSSVKHVFTLQQVLFAFCVQRLKHILADWSEWVSSFSLSWITNLAAMYGNVDYKEVPDHHGGVTSSLKSSLTTPRIPIWIPISTVWPLLIYCGNNIYLSKIGRRVCLLIHSLIQLFDFHLCFSLGNKLPKPCPQHHMNNIFSLHRTQRLKILILIPIHEYGQSEWWHFNID